MGQVKVQTAGGLEIRQEDQPAGEVRILNLIEALVTMLVNASAEKIALIHLELKLVRVIGGRRYSANDLRLVFILSISSLI